MPKGISVSVTKIIVQENMRNWVDSGIICMGILEIKPFFALNIAALKIVEVILDINEENKKGNKVPQD